MLKSNLVDPHKLKELITNIFVSDGMNLENAKIISEHLVKANLRGVDSHGVSRVPIYLKRMEMGVVVKNGNPKIERETNVSALIDGQNLSGIVVANEAIQLGVKKAKESGIAVVGVTNSNHCGMLADYTSYAAEKGYIALATTNAPPNMAPWGGCEKFFGTNPFSYAIPASDTNIIFDTATSVVARGKIILAEKNGKKIPLGWAITKEGKPTENPKEALEGLVLPVGGPKGYGLAFMVDALSGVFTGANYGPYIPDLYNDLESIQNIGHYFFIMRMDLFQEKHEFLKRIDDVIDKLKNVQLSEGVEQIYLPGEIEMKLEQDRIENGLLLSDEVINNLNELVRKYDLNSELFKGEK